jgi:hypothetical protein
MRLPAGKSLTLATCKSAVGDNVVLTVLLLFAEFGSIVPVGSVIDAVLEMVPVAEPAIVPLIVIVTALFAGKVATLAETTLVAEMLIEAGQIAPLVAFEQLAVTPLMAVFTESEKSVPFAALGPALLMTKV